MVTERNKLLTKVLCGLIILVSGIVIGAGITIMLVKQRVIWINKPHKDVNEITQMIRNKYELDESQTSRVQQLINDAFQQKKQYDDEEDQRREAGAQKMIVEMNSIMTPEQFKRWNNDFQKMREKFKKRAEK